MKKVLYHVDYFTIYFWSFKCIFSSNRDWSAMRSWDLFLGACQTAALARDIHCRAFNVLPTVKFNVINMERCVL